ncbi:MAG: DUF1439 domain-containing protein [Bacterioplanes sp.]|nr:DUF1439 domain-containing protein [Bacterioplanes sp.]
MPAWFFKIGLLTLLTLSAQAQEIRLTESELQQQLQTLMPMQQQQGPLFIIIDEPTLTLLSNRNRLSLTVRLQINSSLGLQSRGWLTANSGIRYERQTHAFYLQDPELTELQIEGMAPALQAHLKPVIETWLMPALSQEPIYRLREDDMMEAMARSFLQSVTVEDDALVLRLNML